MSEKMTKQELKDYKRKLHEEEQQLKIKVGYITLDRIAKSLYRVIPKYFLEEPELRNALEVYLNKRNIELKGEEDDD